MKKFLSPVQRNIEIKARYTKKGDLYPKVFHYQETLVQHDTFFSSKTGRLKLREEKGHEAHLIQYDRNDQTDAKLCTFILTPVPDAESLKKILAKSNGVIGVVKKERELYFHYTGETQTRIHIDTVEGLGHFIELEVRLVKESETQEKGVEIAQTLRSILDIQDEDLIDCAYFDLLEKQK